MNRNPAGFRILTAGAYLALLGVYLLYWGHVEYFIDDWFLLRHFREAARGGPAGAVDLARAAAQNDIYKVFRLQWLSILYGALVAWLGGYAAKFNFGLLLLLHGGCAWLLCQGLRRLGLAGGLSFLAGALYLLAPTAHFALVTYLTTPFLVFSTFWTLQLLWWSAGRGAAAAGAVYAVAGLFSGEQVFALLWGAPALAVLLLAPGGRIRPALTRLVAPWTAMAAALGAYLLWVNRTAVAASDLERRYEWTWRQAKSNILLIYSEWRRLSGLTPDAHYRLSAGWPEAALAVLAALIVAGLIWRWRDDSAAGAVSLWRVLWFAAAAAALAYGPVLWIAGGYARFRYHYVPSPYLGLGAAALCWSLGRWLPRPTPALAGALIAGLFTLNAAADLRQCWIPQSGEHRSLTAALRTLGNVAPGDRLVISGTPFATGTAQHFTMHSSVSANPFAVWATGAASLEVARELFQQHGRLMFYQTDYQRPLPEEELRKTHVLVRSSPDRWASCRFVARRLPDGRFHLLPLKGVEPREGSFSRDQLALAGPVIYFPKSAETHQAPAW